MPLDFDSADLDGAHFMVWCQSWEHYRPYSTRARRRSLYTRSLQYQSPSPDRRRAHSYSRVPPGDPSTPRSPTQIASRNSRSESLQTCIGRGWFLQPPLQCQKASKKRANAFRSVLTTIFKTRRPWSPIKVPMWREQSLKKASKQINSQSVQEPTYPVSQTSDGNYGDESSVGVLATIASQVALHFYVEVCPLSFDSVHGSGMSLLGPKHQCLVRLIWQ